jgi:HD-like signal output (HDOD) protein
MRFAGARALIAPPEVPAATERERERLTRLLVTTFWSDTYEPPLLPRSFLEILAVTKNPDASVDQVLGVVSQDPFIAAQVLRRARSAFYARGNPVTSLRHAVVRLGMDVIRNIFVLACVESHVFKATRFEGSMEMLRKHAVGTAHAAEVVAKRSGAVVDGFLLGLLHDIGFAACYVAVAESVGRGEAPPAPSLSEAASHVHAAVGEMLCQKWKLPEGLGEAIRDHHAEDFSAPPLCVLAIAELTAGEFGFPGLEAIPERDDRIAKAYRTLGLAPFDEDLSRAVADRLAKQGI